MMVLCFCFFLEGDSDVLWKDVEAANISLVRREINSSRSNEEARETSLNGVLNPTTCLHLSDVLLFTVDTRHYPQYDL